MVPVASAELVSPLSTYLLIRFPAPFDLLSKFLEGSVNANVLLQGASPSAASGKQQTEKFAICIAEDKHLGKTGQAISKDRSLLKVDSDQDQRENKQRKKKNHKHIESKNKDPKCIMKTKNNTKAAWTTDASKYNHSILDTGHTSTGTSSCLSRRGKELLGPTSTLLWFNLVGMGWEKDRLIGQKRKGK